MVVIPNFTHLRNVELVVKLVKMCHEQGSILNLEICDAKTSFDVGLPTLYQAASYFDLPEDSDFPRRHKRRVLSTACKGKKLGGHT